MNPRYGIPYYSLSRGAPSTSWVFLHLSKLLCVDCNDNITINFRCCQSILHNFILSRTGERTNFTGIRTARRQLHEKKNAFHIIPRREWRRRTIMIGSPKGRIAPPCGWRHGRMVAKRRKRGETSVVLFGCRTKCFHKKFQISADRLPHVDKISCLAKSFAKSAFTVV